MPISMYTSDVLLFYNSQQGKDIVVVKILQREKYAFGLLENWTNQQMENRNGNMNMMCHMYERSN